jgi:hypothetical protein
VNGSDFGRRSATDNRSGAFHFQASWKAPGFQHRPFRVERSFSTFQRLLQKATVKISARNFLKIQPSRCGRGYPDG